MEKSFDFYGVALRLDSDHPETLSRLEKDFAYFADPAGCIDRPAQARPQVRISLSLGLPPPMPTDAMPFFKWKSCVLYNRSSERIVSYPEGALLLYDFSMETGRLFASSPDLLRELAYLTVHSRIGQLLDRRGLHRVHALGFAYRGQGGLLLLPMGGGKTTLFMELLRSSEFNFLSDDIPLLSSSDAGLKAFPLRPGLVSRDGAGISDARMDLFRRRQHGDKYLVDLELYESRIARSAPLRWILIGERGAASEPGILPCAPFAAWRALFLNCVLGLGTPQVLELLLPVPPFLPGLARLAHIGALRLQAVCNALRGPRGYRFHLCSDSSRNAAALAAFLERSHRP